MSFRLLIKSFSGRLVSIPKDVIKLIHLFVNKGLNLNTFVLYSYEPYTPRLHNITTNKDYEIVSTNTEISFNLEPQLIVNNCIFPTFFTNNRLFYGNPLSNKWSLIFQHSRGRSIPAIFDPYDVNLKHPETIETTISVTLFHSGALWSDICNMYQFKLPSLYKYYDDHLSYHEPSIVYNNSKQTLYLINSRANHIDKLGTLKTEKFV